VALRTGGDAVIVENLPAIVVAAKLKEPTAEFSTP
jgi:hypothetical protein